jgi:hypothetical protein
MYLSGMERTMICTTSSHKTSACRQSRTIYAHLEVKENRVSLECYDSQECLVL